MTKSSEGPSEDLGAVRKAHQANFAKLLLGSDSHARPGANLGHIHTVRGFITNVNRQGVERIVARVVTEYFDLPSNTEKNKKEEVLRALQQDVLAASFSTDQWAQIQGAAKEIYVAWMRMFSFSRMGGTNPQIYLEDGSGPRGYDRRGIRD